MNAPSGAPFEEPAGEPGAWPEVFLAFLRLGLTSFGGPTAHIGYFRAAFVERRRWLGEAAFGELVTLCQFLPGPASSQTGFAIGLMRAGPVGALAAWVGFTLPSALLLTALALGAPALQGPLARGALHGLELVAAAVVAQALLGMIRTLAAGATRAAIALAGLALGLLAPGGAGQIVAIVFGVTVGAALLRETAADSIDALRIRVPPWVGLAALATFLLLLIGGPLFASVGGSNDLMRFDAFYRSGALVFGGGHVVLPLLRSAVVSPGWVDPKTFLAGYGATQAMPGPLFAFAAYLGAVMDGPKGAALGLLAIFLPGLLALVAALPFWDRLRRVARARAAMAGANAAVVGLLGAALYAAIWRPAVTDSGDVTLVAMGFGLLTAFRAPPILVVVLGAAAGALRTMIG